ncbi:MAG TPA: penicillin acylase family protein [Burkholderiaceae bacterium]|nr:penicillin acylase family protein [Burkholderiaceae bacterium]
MRVMRLIGVVALLIAVAMLGAFLWYRKASQPTHEGSLVVGGISKQVVISRDARALPYIDAGDEADAIFALGYVHAQDRLWQMTFNRRIAQGRVAEIAGPGALDTDRFLRTLGIYRVAQYAAGRLDPETRRLLEAYAAGVNASLAQRSGPQPLEFVLTRSPPPEPWQVADTLAWTLIMALDLSRTYRDELTRLRLASRLPRAEIDEFKPPYPGDVPAAIADYPRIYRALGLFNSAQSQTSGPPRVAADNSLESFAALDETPGIGSNNWVVSGAHTRSGKPLLANDPHLGLTTPSVWYFARLRAPEFEVFGATLPGVPYVLLGRNRDVAWGFTNTGPDVQDLYIERINPDHPDQYQTPEGFARFESRTERILVRGADPVDLVVRSTRHGPVLSGVLGKVDKLIDGSRYVLALRWTALEGDDMTLASVRAMNRAHNAKEFEGALANFGLAMQNIVYADVEGNIGFVAAGRVPIRRPDNDLQGLAPAPGWDAKYDWAGWLPYSELPRVFNPKSGMIVTANQKTIPPGYGHYITSDWFLPYRADRITQLLEATPKHDMASFRRIQGDVVSLAARDLLEALRALAPEPATNAGKVALARLMAWDGTMNVNAPEPLLFHAWLRHLRARIFDDDLGPLAADLVGQAELTRATLQVLRGATHARDWCDDRNTPQRHTTCTELASEALDAAVIELAKETGRDPLGLKWGEAHRAVHEHRPFSNVPLLRDWFELVVPAPGDSFTVNVGQLGLRAGSDWRAPYVTRHGPSLRAIYDLSPGATGEWIYTTGQVGNPFADNYGDLLQSWLKVEYWPISWDRPKSDPLPHKTLSLRPAPR